MPNTVQDKKVFSLLEVSKSIQRTLSDRYSSSFWVTAEMNKLNYYKHSGHCYPELVQKDGNTVIAQMRSVLWKDTYEKANTLFLKVLKEPLRDGIKVLFLARIEYNPVYGLSLQILDIDPHYTLGDLEREKAEAIGRLKKEGLFDQNRRLTLASLPQRIAIISVETSKGLADFLRILDGNERGYQFFHMLFPSLLQGEKAVKDIIRQLNLIRKVAQHFDLVVIVRGGGGDVGLSCYNHYELASAIATFPLPVLTGIGHATNETVAEMIAWYNAITPTKLAEFLLERMDIMALPLQRFQEVISVRSLQILEREKQHLSAESRLFRGVSRNVLQQHRQKLHRFQLQLSSGAYRHVKDNFQQLGYLQRHIKDLQTHFRKSRQNELDRILQRLRLSTVATLKTNTVELNHLEQQVHIMDPSHVLQRGYSITRFQGKAVYEASKVKPGDLIETQLAQGILYSTISSKNTNSPNNE